MKLGKTSVILIVVVLLCLICGGGCSTYNRLVSQSENVEEAWAKVQNQYQRRYDLIPNLNKTVAAYAQHEKDVFVKVTEARAGLDKAANEAKAMENENALENEQNFQRYTDAQANLDKAFNIYVNAVKEAYPDLKANENFRDLEVALEGCENRIATERATYTQVVKEYNVSVRKFPANIWAGIFGFSTKPQYRADASAQSAPTVDF